eukprot:11433771-Heterocapsa_arctica.AAC.1
MMPSLSSHFCSAKAMDTKPGGGSVFSGGTLGTAGSAESSAYLAAKVATSAEAFAAAASASQTAARC